MSSRRRGYQWDDNAAMLRLPITGVGSRFWREITNSKAKLGIGTKDKRRKLRRRRQCQRTTAPAWILLDVANRPIVLEKGATVPIWKMLNSYFFAPKNEF